jgi:hypothetical protein
MDLQLVRENFTFFYDGNEPSFIFELPLSAYQSLQFGKNISMRITDYVAIHNSPVNPTILYLESPNIRNAWNNLNGSFTYLTSENTTNNNNAIFKLSELPKEFTFRIADLYEIAQSRRSCFISIEIMYSPDDLEFVSSFKRQL